METTLIRYDFDDFMSYKENNNILEDSLQSHCLNNNFINLGIRTEFMTELQEIISNIMKGINPNEMAFKNTLREYLNKINKNNYNELITSLRNLEYSSENNFKVLSLELIVRSMNDILSAKGFAKEGDRTISDVNADIVNDFIDLFIEIGGNKLYFKNIFKNTCQEYFSDFINPEKSLDENNLHRVDNYKGLMNFIGVLLIRGLMTEKIAEQCLKKSAELILHKNKTADETTNIFNGYERLLNKVLEYIEKNKNMELLSSVKTIHNSIIQRQNLKKFTLITHQKLSDRISAIL